MGTVSNVTAVSRTSIHNITEMMAMIITRSPSKSVTPAVNNSLSASTSLVSRVMMRPTGLRS